MNNCKCSEQVEQLRRDVAEAARSTKRMCGSLHGWDTFAEQLASLSPQPEPLKACPVCGKQPEPEQDYQRVRYVCRHRDTAFAQWFVLGCGVYSDSEPTARRLWNTLPGGAK